MKIFKISQTINTGYDTFSDAVVIAKDENSAKRIHPHRQIFDKIFYDDNKKQFWSRYANSEETYLFEDTYGTWTNNLDLIEVEEIGTAKKGAKEGVVCASFHAG